MPITPRTLYTPPSKKRDQPLSTAAIVPEPKRDPGSCYGCVFDGCSEEICSTIQLHLMSCADFVFKRKYIRIDGILT